MNNKTIITIVIVLVLGIFTAYYFVYVKPYLPEYNWTQSYSYKDKEPYGLKYFYENLKSSKKDDNFILMKSSFNSSLVTEKKNEGVYLCIGDKWYGDNNEMLHILKFVENGNTAFFSLNEFPESLIEKLEIVDNLEYCLCYKNSNTANEIFWNNDSITKCYSFTHWYLKWAEPYNWAKFYPEFVEELNTIHPVKIICKKDSIYPSFIEIRYKKGKIFLHTSPVLFTNYHFITDTGFNYVENVLSQVPDNMIYWDELSKKHYTDSSENMDKQNPLKYVLSRNSLRWAWYLLISTIILFLIFGAKRKQKPIPLMQENKNSTFEYTKAVSALYLQSGDHTHIANEMWHLFVVFVKIKYNVVLDNSDKPVELSNLSIKSKISLEFLEDLLKLKNIVCYNWGKDAKTLVEFHNALNYFYKNCN